MKNRYCANCGRDIGEQANFCSGCGQPLRETARVATPEADMTLPPDPRPLFAQPPSTEVARGDGSALRTGALVVGILAGIIALVSAVATLMIGGLGSTFAAEDAGLIVGLGWSALVFSFLGILGAGLALAKPRISAGILLVSTLGITISISWFAVLAAPLFLIACILAFLGRHKIA